eukprot:CAMPEP_0119133168 /NCGR_PEP_ID=MMETSP1310-20130426/13186_1 /TAXON_ID=464262 /ORGANISM="Genus nov. species nov., Strain RCC2339" /LENGTH=196 /DNA_ID=CAMNT_0007123851 /DNA_START=170 /DNA_END=758 /DNA_ORIENTATION=-
MVEKLLVLIIGDMHVPHRAATLPPKFKKMLVPGKIQHVICTGNLCTKEMHDYLRTVASDVHVVCGDFDENKAFPEVKVVKIGGFSFGIVHGHQVVPWGDPEALAIYQRQLDVDILVSGHTHTLDIHTKDSKLFLNPGSATGAYSGFSSDILPSFILLDIEEEKQNVIAFSYQLKSSLIVDKYEWGKGNANCTKSKL